MSLSLGISARKMAQARPFRPFDVADLYWWLDANDLSTITKDGSGNVSQWNDKSGSSRNVLQGSAAAKPVYQAAGVEGYPSIRFDGGDQLDLAAQETLAACTVFIVGFGDSGHIMADSGSPGNARIYDGHFVVDGSLDRDVSNPLAADKGSIATFVFSGSNITGRLNGTQTGTNSSSPTFTFNTVGGKRSIATGIPLLTGDIAKILVYNRVLNATEIGQIEKALADEYRIYHPNADWIAAEYSSFNQTRIHANGWNRSDVPAMLLMVGGQSNAGGWLSTPDEYSSTYTGDIPGANLLSFFGNILLPFNEAEQVSGGTIGTLTTTIVKLRETFTKEALYGSIEYRNGTSLAVDWKPSPPSALYTAATSRWSNAISGLKNNFGYKNVDAALLWIQGEEDGIDLTNSGNYQANLTAFLAAVRASLSEANLPFHISRLSDNQTGITYLSTIRTAQDAVIAADSDAYLVDTDGVEMRTGSGVHFSADGYIDIGNAAAASIVASL